MIRQSRVIRDWTFSPEKNLYTPWLRDYVIQILNFHFFGVIGVIDVIGVISVISVIGVISVIDVIYVRYQM